MKTPRYEDSMKWSLVLGLVVILAGITGFMVVNRHEFFPEMYHMNATQKHGTKSAHEKKDSLDSRAEHHEH